MQVAFAIDNTYSVICPVGSELRCLSSSLRVRVRGEREADSTHSTVRLTGTAVRASPAVPAKIGVDLRLSAADELFSRAFALGRHLSLAADERRSTPINWIRRPSACWVPSLRSPTPWAPDFSRKCTSGPCSENSAFAASALSPKLHSQSPTKGTLQESTLQISSSKTVGPSNSAAFRFMGLFKWHGLHCGRPLGVHPAVRLTGAAAEAWPSERRGGDPGVEFLLGAVSPVAKPGNGRVREGGGQVLEIPVFGWGEGGVAERVGEAPTDLDEVVEAQLMRNGVIVVGNDGGGELVREIPVQGEIGAGGAVVDFEELALRLQQVEPEIVGNLKQSGVLVRVGGHQAQGPQVVQQAGGIGDFSVQAADARGLLGDQRRDHAVHPDFAEGDRADGGAHHVVERDEGGHRFDAVHAEHGDGRSEERRVGKEGR